MERSNRRPTQRTGPVVDRYEYRNAAGELIFVVSRHNTKGFSVSAVPRGSYPSLLYRLPDLLAADLTHSVFVAEGEKDADRLRADDLIGTCNAFGGGRGKWKGGYSRSLRGRSVVILPDTDPTGQEHAVDVAEQLHRFGASVRIVRLPGLPPNGDVSEWFDAGGTAADLILPADAQQVWEPPRGIDILPVHRDPRRGWENYTAGEWNCLAGKRQEIYNSALPTIEKLLRLLLTEPTAEPLKQADISHCLGVSVRRVRQLEYGSIPLAIGANCRRAAAPKKAAIRYLLFTIEVRGSANRTMARSTSHGRFFRPVQPDATTPQLGSNADENGF